MRFSRERQRLKKGQLWRIENQEKLASMPDMGVGSPLEELFVLAFKGWADLEAMYRFVSDEAGCVMGFACDRRAPVICEVCARG